MEWQEEMIIKSLIGYGRTKTRIMEFYSNRTPAYQGKVSSYLDSEEAKKLFIKAELKN